MPKKQPTQGETKPRQFRLGEDTLAHLDVIAAHLSQATARPMSRADAVRFAAREAAEKIPKKSC
jgi:hypothetical protein